MSDIQLAEAPWTLHGTIYMIPFWVSQRTADALPDFVYHPLETASMTPGYGQPVGGLGNLQLIRYTDSPVGPYDELLLMPGEYSYQPDGSPPGKTKTGGRVTRIYVSQKYTCHNGRILWNIPKHLAHFIWTESPSGETSVKVYPFDESKSSEANQAPSDQDIPFFQATFRTIPYLPSMPISTGPLAKLTNAMTLVQPPLSKDLLSQTADGHLPGTDAWCRIVPNESTRHASFGWMDVRQDPRSGESADDQRGVGSSSVSAKPAHAETQRRVGRSADATPLARSPHENFWPGWGRWRLAMVMKDATIDFPAGEHWTTG